MKHLSYYSVIEEYLQKAGFSCILGIHEKISTYLELLWKWNRRMNLVSENSSVRVVEHHVADSIMISGSLFPLPLMDVGSGAGFPGLIAAVVRPELEITLLEKSSKKAAFLKEAVRACSIENARVIRGNVDELDTGFEQVISRAAFKPEVWVQKASRIVLDQGYIWCMLSRFQEMGFLEAMNDLKTLRRFEYKIPGDVSRWAVCIVRSG